MAQGTLGRRWGGEGGFHVLSAFSPWSNFYPAPRAKLNASPPLSLPLSSRGGMQKKRRERGRSSSARRCKMHRSPQQKNLFLLPSYVQQCTGKEKEEGEERGGHNQGLPPPPLSLFRPFPPSALTKCLPGLEIEKGRKHYPCLVLPLLFFSSPELNRAWLQSGGTERERKGS